MALLVEQTISDVLRNHVASPSGEFVPSESLVDVFKQLFKKQIITIGDLTISHFVCILKNPEHIEKKILKILGYFDMSLSYSDELKALVAFEGSEGAAVLVFSTEAFPIEEKKLFYGSNIPAYLAIKQNNKKKYFYEKVIFKKYEDDEDTDDEDIEWKDGISKIVNKITKYIGSDYKFFASPNPTTAKNNTKINRFNKKHHFSLALNKAIQTVINTKILNKAVNSAVDDMRGYAVTLVKNDAPYGKIYNLLQKIDSFKKINFSSSTIFDELIKINIRQALIMAASYKLHIKLNNLSIADLNAAEKEQMTNFFLEIINKNPKSTLILIHSLKMRLLSSNAGRRNNDFY